MSLEKDMQEVALMSKGYKLALAKGEADWEDEEIQFFLPVVLFHTNWDWLEIVAGNTLIEEDAKIVKNFLAQTQSLTEINTDLLNQAVKEKIRKLFK